MLLLFFILIGITSSATELKICAITAGIKKYKPITKEKKRKHDKIVSLVKSKLNRIEVLISKSLINSNINHDDKCLGEFVSINVVKEYKEMKEEIRNLKTQSIYQRF